MKITIVLTLRDGGGKWVTSYGRERGPVRIEEMGRGGGGGEEEEEEEIVDEMLKLAGSNTSCCLSFSTSLGGDGIEPRAGTRDARFAVFDLDRLIPPPPDSVPVSAAKSGASL
jgi:hypothetical protein